MKDLKLKPNADPETNKTYLNGKLVTDEVEHGDRVLFGNNQLYIIVKPPQDVDKGLLDYEDAMKEILDDQIQDLKKAQLKSDLNDKLKRDQSDQELEDLNRKLNADCEIIERDRLKLEEEEER